MHFFYWLILLILSDSYCVEQNLVSVLLKDFDCDCVLVSGSSQQPKLELQYLRYMRLVQKVNTRNR